MRAPARQLKRHAFALLVACALHACAGPSTREQPAVGPLEYVFRNVDADCIRQRIVANQGSKRWQVRSASERELVLERLTEDLDARIRLSPRVYSDVRERLTYAFSGDGAGQLRVAVMPAYVRNAGTDRERMFEAEATTRHLAEFRAGAAALERVCRRR
jgi:hypothetical protein